MRVVFLLRVLLTGILPVFLSSCFALTDIRGLFSNPHKSNTLEFPGDHGNHPRALTEWWYFNGHLQTAAGKNYAYGFCLFRASRFLYAAHISITDLEEKSFQYERVFYPAKRVSNQTSSRIDYGGEQLIELTGPQTFRVKGRVKDTVLDLELQLVRSPMKVNGNSIIDMPEGGLSSYYSLTLLPTRGSLQKGSHLETVTGISWMDHQWGDYYVRDKGWDWFSIQFEDSTEYNLYSFRNEKGRTRKQCVNILDKMEQLSTYEQLQVEYQESWTSPVSGLSYATRWQLVIPGNGDTLYMQANVPGQELWGATARDFLPDYWEGSCTVWKKTREGRLVKGIGFAEQFPLRFKSGMR